MTRLLLLVCVVVCAGVAGCATTEDASGDAPRVVDAESLLFYLSDEGFQLSPVGLASVVGVPLTSGTRYRVVSPSPTTGVQVFAYQFREQDDVERGLATLRRSGPGGSYPRRIHSRGRLAVYTVGRDAVLERVLMRALGEPEIL